MFVAVLGSGGPFSLLATKVQPAPSTPPGLVPSKWSCAQASFDLNRGASGGAHP